MYQEIRGGIRAGKEEENTDTNRKAGRKKGRKKIRKEERKRGKAEREILFCKWWDDNHIAIGAGNAFKDVG
jgi:hypothetical protein